MGGRLWVPVASGPLAAYAAGYGSWLAGRGYSCWTVGHRLGQLELLSRWAEREGLRPDELTPDEAERFLAARRAAAYSSWVSAGSVALPLGYLREMGVVSAVVPVVVDDPLERLLAGYYRYLFDERGLTEHTVLVRYGPDARLFLAATVGPVGLAVERLSARDVSVFLARECPRRGVARAIDLVVAVRSLLRYLYVEGLIAVPLEWAVPRVGGSAGSVAAAGARARGGQAAVGELRSTTNGRQARLRGPAAAGAAGIARR